MTERSNGPYRSGKDAILEKMESQLATECGPRIPRAAAEHTAENTLARIESLEATTADLMKRVDALVQYHDSKGNTEHGD